MKSLGGKIVTLAHLKNIRQRLGKLVMVSGGFDPIHPGHISYIQESKNHGNTLVVIVNGDRFLADKKGKPFQDLHTRCLIVSSIKGVDYVVPFEIENDPTVCEALKMLKPNIFAKGGDRMDEKTIPEWGTCKKHDIQIVTGVGFNKEWSSSAFLDDWQQFRQNK